MEKTVHYEKTLTSEVLFEGRVITLTKDTALLENGKTAEREVVHHHGGACILPYFEDGTICMVRPSVPGVFPSVVSPARASRNAVFSARGRRFTASSNRHAEALSGCATQQTTSTGRLVRVYFAPRFPSPLCSLSRRSTSVVTPQYSVASAHRSR